MAAASKGGFAGGAGKTRIVFTESYRVHRGSHVHEHCNRLAGIKDIVKICKVVTLPPQYSQCDDAGITRYQSPGYC